MWEASVCLWLLHSQLHCDQAGAYIRKVKQLALSLHTVSTALAVALCICVKVSDFQDVS
jgi:hypothetical protein